MQLPSDSAMLLSFINMKLRDDYDSLSSLCDDLELSQQEIEQKLAKIGYHYNAQTNKFE